MNQYLPTRNFVTYLALMAAAIMAGSGDTCWAASGVTLYDVTFDGAPHVLGSTPSFGAGPFPRNTPTAGGQIAGPTGLAEVVASFGPLASQPVRLTALEGDLTDATLGGVNLEFDLTDPQLAAYTRFCAQVDLSIGSVSGTASGLGIFFDAPAIHKVEFSPDGNIRVLDATGLNQIVGAHTPQTKYLVSMTFDRIAAEWSASLDGVTLYQGPVDQTNLVDFRIAMTTGSTTQTAVAAVDNILITAAVPEPATSVLAMCLLVGTLITRRAPRG